MKTCEDNVKVRPAVFAAMQAALIKRLLALMLAILNFANLKLNLIYLQLQCVNRLIRVTCYILRFSNDILNSSQL